VSAVADKLCKRLGYHFRDPALLQTALTHRSVGSRNNERLEFLGDAILNCVIADALFERFPEASEGDLSRMRAHLVKGETLALLAQDLDLGDYLLLGAGELKSGGFRRNSILAGAMEAVFGAAYRDSDFNAAQALILTVYQERLNSVSVDSVAKDPKTRLQEYLQARRLQLPEYAVLSVEGKDHKQVFQVSCQVACLEDPLIGSGRSRRRAEQAAAARTLEELEKNGI